MVNILLLGCDGNAGMNYARSLKMGMDNVKIYGTGFNKYHLKAAEQSGLYEVVYMVDWKKESEYRWVRNFVRDKNIDFVHAQPEEEVEFLCDYGDDVTLKYTSEIPCFGKSYRQRNIFADKTAVQKILGQPVYLFSNVNPTFTIFDGDYWIRANNGAGSKYALPVNSYEECMNWYSYLKVRGKVDTMSDLTISPYLPGREFAVQIFYINGIVFHMQQRERIEHHFAKQMVSGQSSTPSVAVSTNESAVYLEALRAVETVTQSVHEFPNGIYGVDLRCDENNDPVVTEVNYGRYFTTSDFFASFDVNTPVAELLYVVNGELPSYKVGFIRDGIYWTRGLDHDPVWYTKEDLEFL